MVRKLTLWLTMLVVAIVVAVPMWVHLNRHDALPTDDADLRTLLEPMAPVPRDQNGWHYLTRAARVRFWPEGAENVAVAVSRTLLALRAYQKGQARQRAAQPNQPPLVNEIVAQFQDVAGQNDHTEIERQP